MLALDGGAAGQRVHHLGDPLGRVDLHPGLAAGFGRLGGVAGRQVEGFDALFGGGQGHGQHPGHRPQGAVQRYFAQKGGVPRGLLDLAGGGQDGQQQGQVVDGPRLADVGGGQVGGHPAARPAEVEVAGGRPDAVGAFPHRRVGQADQGKGVQSARDVGLHRHPKALQAAESETVQYCVHGRSFPRVNPPVLICPARRTAAGSAGPSA